VRGIFHAEIECRSADPDFEPEYFEDLYWSAFLLHIIGDPSDVPLMWRAKHIDFDTGCAAATLAYLNEHGHADIAEALSAYPELDDDLRDWVAARREYFAEAP
jgi:hypothetical protein